MSKLATNRIPGDVAHTVDPSLTTSFTNIAWGAVFAGVVLALATQLLLNLLGVGIGAAVLDPATSDNPAASTFSIVGGIWFVVAGIIASFIGAYVAARLSGRPSKSTGGYHGVTTWAVTTLVVLFLLTTSVGSLVGGAFSGLSSIVGGVGQTAATAATAAAPALATATDPMGTIEQQIRNASGGNDPAALQTAAVSAMTAVATGDQSKIDDAKTRAAEALAKAQNIPVDQARAKVDEYEASYKASVEEAKQQALAAAQTATKVVSRGALLGFLALMLGAIAAWFGGTAGTKPALLVEEHTSTQRL
ncbi:PhnA-like protein [Rhizobium leguminosarum]|uniref:PhnA-like protein n=1 Tax=Rhizobium leguminosarum TaxID=384 RepID=UPI001C947B87|nr:PhnA-like protein [Rhizobium leguminosarum]MBY5796198.1 PhnA-like protein [Rhizobium leguminosarum]